jgi:hypothetical protein
MGRVGRGCCFPEIDGGHRDRASPRGTWFLTDGVHAVISEELPGITPTQTLPHQEGGL